MFRNSHFSGIPASQQRDRERPIACVNHKSCLIRITSGVVKKVAPGSVPAWMLVGYVESTEKVEKKECQADLFILTPARRSSTAM